MTPVSRYTKSMSKTGPVSLNGRRFGLLTVLHFVKYTTGYVGHWKCKCDCGKEVIVCASALYTGNTRSCGCLRASKQPPGFAGARRLYVGYKKDAMKRAFVFDLTFEQFMDLTSRNCIYCNIGPSKVSLCRSGYTEKGKAHSTYIYNGLDRVDSSKGYLLDNLVTCCKDCNIAKGTKSVEEFLAWVQRLAAHQNFRQEDPPQEDDRSTV